MRVIFLVFYCGLDFGVPWPKKSSSQTLWIIGSSENIFCLFLCCLHSFVTNHSCCIKCWQIYQIKCMGQRFGLNLE